MLAQPIHDVLAAARHVLLAGCGGGYDLFGAVPLAVELWEAGARGPHVWLSPLSSTYWFFDLPAVARTNLLIPHLGATQSIWEVTALIEGLRKSMTLQGRSTIPL